MTRLDFPFPQITTSDLDIPIIGQLPAAKFPLSDEFEPSPVKVKCFEAAFRREGFWNQGLEHTPGNAHHSLIFADADAELDHQALWVPAGVRRTTKKHEPPEMFC